MDSLKSKIFMFFFVLLLLLMALIFTLVYRTTYQHTLHQIEEQLSAGYQVFNSELQSRRQFQANIAELITQDFGLRSEIADFSENKNIESLRVTLNNFRSRSDAQFALAADADGRILTSSNNEFVTGSMIQFKNLFNLSASNHDALVFINGHLFHVFATPIYVPKPNLLGWFVLGFAIDDQMAVHFSKLTNLDVSFVRLGSTPNEPLMVVASSLTHETQKALSQLPNFPNNDSHTIVKLLGYDHVLYTAVLPSGDDTKLFVVLQQSLTAALRDYEILQWQFLFILGLALILSGVGAFLIASSVSRPLSLMVNYVRRVGSGEYNAPIPQGTRGEVGILMEEFTAMQKAIAEREATIEYAAFHDALTDLPNRLRFQQILQDSIASHGDENSLAVLIVGLNHFKDVNDTLSHFSGDQLLRQVAKRLQEVLRNIDTVARFGGDAFVILLRNIELADVVPLTLRYQAIFADPFDVENIALTMNASIGIAIYPEHGETPTLLLQCAEIAMYVSKEKHVLYALYSGQQNRHSLLRLSLMSELKGAIERDELVLHFQPKLNLSTQMIIGAECLVRWRHPVHGFIYPDDFIPLAEQTGNIRYLTSWVLEKALAQNRLWREQGMNLSMAINISVVDLQDTSLLDRINQLLTREQLPASSVVLEITESSIMNDVNKAVELLSNMQASGLHLSVDDYGTGYSSMAQLKRLPVNELKIDKSFVLDVMKNTDDAIIVRSTIELGHNMGLMVVAEGVETREAMNLLTEFGCDCIQGYYLTKPLPLAEFEKWLQQSSYRTNSHLT